MIKKGSSKTLDTQHHTRLTDFQHQQNVIINTQDNIQRIGQQLADLSKQTLSNLSEDAFQRYLELRDQQQELEKELVVLQKASKEIDYYVDNADIIFKYYDIVENGNVTENENSGAVTEHSILKFFSSYKDDVPPVDDNITSQIQDEDRASLLERYMQHTDSNYIRSLAGEENDTCPVCECKNRTLLINDGIVFCNECYTIETVIVDHDKPSYRDPPKEISYFSYKRLNHLNEFGFSVHFVLNE